MGNYTILSKGLGLGPVHPVYWTRSDDDTYQKMDIYHYLNRSSTTRHYT